MLPICNLISKLCVLTIEVKKPTVEGKLCPHFDSANFLLPCEQTVICLFGCLICPYPPPPPSPKSGSEEHHCFMLCTSASISLSVTKSCLL